jgi:hypothetical protein
VADFGTATEGVVDVGAGTIAINPTIANGRAKATQS